MKLLLRTSIVLLFGTALVGLPRSAAGQDYPPPESPPPEYPPPEYPPPEQPPPTYAPPRAYVAPLPPERPRRRHWLETIDRPGVYIGGALVGAFITDQSGTIADVDFIDDGVGGQAILGFRLAPMLALELGYASTVHDEADWSGVDHIAIHQATADLKIIFPSRSPVRPFIQGGGGYYGMHTGEDRWVHGGGFQIGGGVDFWLDRYWTLGLRVLYHGVKFGRLHDDVLVLDRPWLGWISGDVNVQLHF